MSRALYGIAQLIIVPISDIMSTQVRQSTGMNHPVWLSSGHGKEVGGTK